MVLNLSLRLNEKLKPYEDPEWQADAFRGELLASSYLIRKMNSFEVMEKCGVCFDAAKVQLKNLKANKFHEISC